MAMWKKDNCNFGWMNIIDFAKDEELAKRYLHYEFDGGREFFTTETTGVKKAQMVLAYNKGRRGTIGWRVFCLPDGEICFISDPTNYMLRLSGRTAWTKGHECLSTYASLYDNEREGISACPMNERVYDMLPEYLKPGITPYWLDSIWKNGMKAVISGRKEELSLWEDDKQEESIEHEAAIRIVARNIPLSIMINVRNPFNDGTKEYKAMEMKF